MNAAPQPAPTPAQAPAEAHDNVLVPLAVLEDASQALGNFVSDLGWGDADMQAMDNLDAYIAQHKAKPQPKGTVSEFTNELGNAIRITIEGPISTSENVLTPMEADKLRGALNEHATQAPAPAQAVRATGIPADGVAMRSRPERFRSRDGGQWIDDDDFGFDAMLKIDGDFGSDADREAYAQFLCDKLNAQAPAVTQQVPPILEWRPGSNLFKDWCAAWFGPDADDTYLARAIGAFPAQFHPALSGARYTHATKGGSYALLGYASLQTDAPLNDMAEVVIYRGDDGRLWARDVDEFRSRFAAVSKPPVQGSEP